MDVETENVDMEDGEVDESNEVSNSLDFNKMMSTLPELGGMSVFRLH